MKKYIVTVNGTQYEVMVEQVEESDTVQSTTPATAPRAPKATKEKGGAIKITVPMAGTINEMLVKVGDRVTRGQTVCTLEAMKMVNNIPAPQDGVVVTIEVSAGAMVESDAVVITLD